MHVRGSMGNVASRHSHNTKAIIIKAPIVKRTITIGPFQANEVPPPEIGTW